MASTTGKKILRLVGVLVLAGLAWALKEYVGEAPAETTSPPITAERETTARPSRSPSVPARADAPRLDDATIAAGDRAIVEAFRNERSEVWVESAGRIDRTLPDDTEGSPHQRFVVELPSGHTVLVAHNIDLAPRVPLAKRERIEFRGRYEWNDRGGVIHWTHHDPAQRRPGGWIRHEGVNYR